MSILLSILLTLPAHTIEKLASVPAADYAAIKIDSRGDIFYRDQGVLVGEEFTYPFAGDSRKLHSNPNASKKLFLNFDGYDFSATVIADYDPNPPTIAQPASLSDNVMYVIWHHVAEDYSPFDVDVTTEKPTGTYGEIVFTQEVDANGDCLVECGWGGVAWLGAWGSIPGLVFVDNVYGSVNKAECASHEAGHLLDLHHDGVKVRNETREYFYGYGDNWAPIMGVSYNTYVTQWDSGTYRYANNHENDVEIIRSQLGTSPLPATITSSSDIDYYSYDFNTATEIVVAPSGVSGFNLDVGLIYNDVIYDLQDLSARIIVPPGQHQFGVYGAYVDYGDSLGRYVVKFNDFVISDNGIYICHNIASAYSSGDWYADGVFIGRGTTITLPSGKYDLLYDSNSGQTVTAVDVKPGKTSRECR